VLRSVVSVFVLLTVLVMAGARATTANEPAFNVIVNPRNPASAIDRDFLRNAFLKKAAVWRSTGETMRPIGLSAKFSARDQFTRKVLKKTPAQLKAYWNQQIFSGKGVPPPEADSTADVIAYVLAHPGAVGYLPAGVDAGDAKVVEVR
jgi:ABC-type phosphate transport system substrate-binding protein